VAGSGDPARRYAQAAFEVALEEGNLAAWRAGLADVAEVYAIPEVQLFLGDDRIPLDERLAFVDRVLDVAPSVRNLAKLLVVKRRVPLAPRIAQLFNRLADAHEGVVEAEVTTATDLTPELRVRIERALSEGLGGRQIRLTHRTDPSLLGGIVIKVGDKLVDGSVRTRLRLLRQHLAAAP
jgi:F-type H+-transporting ATPase subunit delta